MSVVLLLLIAALVCFLVPAIKALFNNSFDFTDSGLAFATLALILGHGLG
jgi:hypothetical protein